MALTFGTGPEPAAIPTSPAQHVSEISLATFQRVALSAASDESVPMLSAIADELQVARDEYESALEAAEALIAFGSDPDVDELEALALSYIMAAQRAAGSRALLLRLRREPERIAAQRTIEEVQEIEGRIDPVRSSFDQASMVERFKAEGLL